MVFLMKMLILAIILLLTGCAGLETPESTPSPTQKIIEDEIASFSTEILDEDEERVQNLWLSATVINGTLIEPGEIFSFNDTVGARTEEKGYEEAKILIGRERGYAVGGGVCQISSTLYNAAKSAGMEIIERHNHQNEVYYVEIGNDAAVSYGELDFKFKNNSGSTIRIGATAENGHVYAKLYKRTIE